VTGVQTCALPIWEQNSIKVYGYKTTLVGTLQPTGTGVDQTMFMTIETAQDIARSSLTTAAQPLKIPADSISTVMVKVKPGTDIHMVALQIQQNVADVTPIESPDLFVAFQNQMNGLLWGFFVLTLIMWGLAALMLGVNFSMAANQRRREIAVLRAVGAMPGFVFRLVLIEASLLAAGGAVAGITIAVLFFLLFKNAITASLKIPFLFPSASSLAGLFGVGLGLAIIVVILSALVPAIRISKQELAIAMRD
jgi:putative ABC transport system permease protein